MKYCVVFLIVYSLTLTKGLQRVCRDWFGKPCLDFEDKNEYLVVQNQLVQEIPLLKKAYSVSFKFKLLAYSAGERNVIHFTTGGDISVYGYITPAVWYNCDTNILTICSAVNGNPNFCFQALEKIPFNDWTTIRISQIQLNGFYRFRVYIGGKPAYMVRLYSDINSNPQIFTNVKVYIANPWSLSQNATIKDLKILNGNCEQIIEDRKSPLVQGNLIAIIPRLEKTFKIFFDVKPTSFSEGLHNVIDTMENNNNNRVLGVWLHSSGDGSIYIDSYINGKLGNFFKSEPITLKKWSKIEISQMIHEGFYVYRIKLNGNLIFATENTQSKTFSNVHVYASNPWDKVQDSLIKDLRIINGLSDDVSLANIEVIAKDFNFPAEVELKMNNLIGKLPLLKASYTISFKIKLTALPVGWRSVIHLTTSGDYYRIPAIFFYDKTGMYIWNSFASSLFFKTPDLPLNTWSNVQISQYQTNGIYSFRVYINGTITNSMSNIIALSFENVMVYASSPYFYPQLGFIKDLRIVNGNQ